MTLGSLFSSPACIPTLEQPSEERVDATCVFLKKCNGSACPARNPNCLFYWGLFKVKCMQTFFKKAPNWTSKLLQSNCFVSIGKNPRLSWLIRKDLYPENFWTEQRDGGLGEEWSRLSLSFLNCCAMSNPLPRKRLKEKVTDIRLGFKKYTFILVCFWVETVNHLFPKVTEWFAFRSWFWTQRCVFFLELLQSVDLVNKWWTSKALELGLH